MKEYSDQDIDRIAQDLVDYKADWVAQFAHKLYTEGFMCGFKEGVRWILSQMRGEAR